MIFPVGGVHLHLAGLDALPWVAESYAAKPARDGAPLHASFSAEPSAWRVDVREAAPFPDVARAVATYHLLPADRPALRWRRAGERSIGRRGGQLHAQVSPTDATFTRARYPGEALIDAATATAMALQPQLLFLHGAVLHRDGRAIVVSGLSGAGKTTTALALADAGWALGGDEVFGFDPDAVTADPVPRAVLARTGGHLPFSADARSSPRRLVVLPSALVAPLPLTHVLLLRSFGAEPAVRVVEPVADPALLDSVPVAASWGTDKVRQAFRVARLLAGLRKLVVADVQLGTPQATARAITTFTSESAARHP